MTTETETFALPEVIAREYRSGEITLKSTQLLAPFAPSMAHVLRTHAATNPDREAATEHRGGSDRRRITWGEMRRRADAIAAFLLAEGAGPRRPLLILSGNSLDHLLMMSGAFTAGVPVVPVTPAYSLLSKDFARLRAIVGVCKPGVVFASGEAEFGSALDAIAGFVPTRVVSGPSTPSAIGLDDLPDLPADPAVERAFSELTPKTVAKIMFTSGSTGTPKGVVTTHRMLCSNQQGFLQVWPFLGTEPPILVDWLPWSHVFGGNHVLGMALAGGGTIHIDAGRPKGGEFGKTLEALSGIAPTMYFNVPLGWSLLVPELESNRAFAEHFFSRLRLMFNAGSSMPETLWQRLKTVAAEVADHPVPLTSGFGSTETAPTVTTAHELSPPYGGIGTPMPGVTVKLVPAGEKLEARVKGPNVFPGYYEDEAATAAAFDDDGFFKTGDALSLIDPDDPSAGMLFGGRLGENFKLMSGTWVTVGSLRTRLLAHVEVLADAVIAGADEEYVTALAWAAPDLEIDDAALRQLIAAGLGRMGEKAGASGRVNRLLLIKDPPSMESGEITDKGYINQRRVLERRASEVARLYAEPPDPEVILAGVGQQDDRKENR